MRPIDADTLKEKARKLIPRYYASVVMNLFDLVDNLADNMPTIEPKKGKWTDHTCINWHGYHCSVCDYETQRATNYCPNCGARMERSEDAET